MPSPTETVVRANPYALPSSLKEAVVDALVNLTHARVSGAGEEGRSVYGARPRALLSSSFLLPRRGSTGDDEVTSPIWISSHGLDLQVAANGAGTVSVKPRLSVYVRVLPNVEDLQRPDCRPHFRLRREVSERLRNEVRDALDLEWETVKGAHTSRYKHPDWPAIRDRVRREVYERAGVPSDLANLFGEEEGGAPEEAEGAPEAIEAGSPGEFRYRDEHFEPLSVPHKWLRLDIELPPLRLSPYAAEHEIAQVAADHAATMQGVIGAHLTAYYDNVDPLTGGQWWAYRRTARVLPSQYRDWARYLDTVRSSGAPVAAPVHELAWDIQVARDWLDPTRLNLHIALENTSQEPATQVEEQDHALFLVSLEVELPASVHRPLRLERVEPSYRYNAHLQYPAIGHNGGVQTLLAEGESVRLATTWAPRYTQPRILPLDYPGVVRTIRDLSRPEGLEGVAPIVTQLRCWLDELPARVDLSDGLEAADCEGREREQEKFATDLKAWGKEIEAIETGLAILKESRKHWHARGPQDDPRALPFEAWLAMNEAMADMMRARTGNDTAKWRLFQLAFVMANLSAFVTRLPEYKHYYAAARDDTVTLLYFATGGGKSEAFFGLLVFALFLDRLRGKHLGVTAMIRYPLRLLTIQQAQRCAKVLARAELVRRKYKYPGDALSIGFWVGSGGSPNRHKSPGVSDIKTVEEAAPRPELEEKLRSADRRYDAACRAWNKLPTCPFCDQPTALRLFPGQGGTLAHVCTDPKCPSNHDGYQPLPFYICDEDIYDLAPAVILGTVDKLALIGHSPRTIRRVVGMFGAAPWHKRATGRLVVPNTAELRDGPEAHGCDGIQPAYPEGPAVFHDPFPALLIQDEAHLLDESLGTFAGLFESSLDAVFERLSRPLAALVATDPSGERRRAKVVAASATVSEPERQLEHLYQRKVPAMQFPYPGPSLYESFYAAPQEPDATEQARAGLEDVEKRARQARIYTAFMTNGRPHTATSVAVLSNFHVVVTRLFMALTSNDAEAQERARRDFTAHVSAGPLHAIHVAELARASAGGLATLIDLHRIALTYVTNKKGGDQIMAAESEETRKRHLAEGLQLPAIDTRLITGSVEQGEIQKVVALAQERQRPGQAFPSIDGLLRSIIATSAISHGVDVEELNSMFFAGMPSDIAEYIQASSRVGRTHVGFVVLIPTPQRRRDRYIVEVFDVFHRFLERMVQPAAIDRWADKAIERVFPSLLQAYLCGVVPSRELITAAPEAKRNVSANDAIPDIVRHYRRGELALIERITRFIELAVGLRPEYCPEGTEHYRMLIRRKVEQLLKEWASSSLYAASPLQTYFRDRQDPMMKPMTSLRDVDQGGQIRMAYRDHRGRTQETGAVRDVMDLVRHGVAEFDDDED